MQHRRCNMWLCTVFGLSLSLIAFSTLVIADPTSVYTVSKVEVTNNPNDYFDPWTVEVMKTKKSSILTVKIPTKKELPESTLFKVTLAIAGQEPIEYATGVCDALMDETAGKSFVRAGIPKGSFPQSCPFVAGDWTVFEWNPPSDMIPPGIPDGTVTGAIEILEEGQEPYVKIEYEGQLSHAAPDFGR